MKIDRFPRDDLEFLRIEHLTMLGGEGIFGRHNYLSMAHVTHILTLPTESGVKMVFVEN